MNPSEFLVETLEIFDLPVNYMKGEGHWKNWAEKNRETTIVAQLRRPQKLAKKAGKNKGKDKKDEDKPPTYFDVEPFKKTFTKFVTVNADIRTVFRLEVKEKEKLVVMLFCDENGQMINEKTVDLNSLGKVMN